MSPAKWDPSNPTGSYVSLLPGWLAAITLLGIFVGAISANALNLYSAGMSFAALGLRLPTAFGRAAVTLGMGIAGFVVAIISLTHVETYENFLLVIVYWIGPWLGVMFADQWLRNDRVPTELLYDSSYTNSAGVIAMVVGIVVSVVLFSNQTLFTGLIPRVAPEIGDITFLVGIVLAAALYLALARRKIRA